MSRWRFIVGMAIAVIVAGIGVGTGPVLAQGADESQWPGWAKPGDPALGGARHILLSYIHASAKRPYNFGTSHFLPYVMYLDKDLHPKDTLFDTFLFLPSVTNGEVYFEHATPPSRQVDWEVYLDQAFDPKYQLHALDQTIELAKKMVGHPGTAPVFIGIPYPDPDQRAFGSGLDFGDPTNGSGNRMKAVDWMISEVLRRWKAAHFEHLNLVGFYWFQESVGDKDAALVHAVSEKIHKKGYRLLWIPWFHATGHQQWTDFGFDSAIMQPNLSFNTVSPDKYGERLKINSDDARKYGLGIEIELGSHLSSEEIRSKYLAYLDWGERLGYRNGALLAYYQEYDLLGKAAFSRDPEIRRLYDATYKFIRGK